MGVVRVKDGVSFAIIAPGGFRLLGAFDATAFQLNIDLTITSGCDGEHSGPDDPHHRGEAYDIRSHDLSDSDKRLILATILGKLEPTRFFGFLESGGTDNEHFHFQVKKGTVFP
jgi:hypothetical protein